MHVVLETGIRIGSSSQFSATDAAGFILGIVGIVLLIVGQRRKPPQPPQQQFPPQYQSQPGPQFQPEPPYQPQPGPQYPMQPPAPPRQPPPKKFTMTGVGLAALIAGGALLLVHVDVRTQPAASAPNATHIVLAKQAGGLPQGEMPPDVAAERDRVAKGGIKVQAAVYLHPKHLDAKPGGPEVIFFGVDGRNDPQATMKEFFDSIATQAPALHGVNNYDPGPLGGLLRCVSVATGGTTEIHCLWADAYTAGHLIAGELTEPETAALFLRMRPDLEKPS